MHTKLNEMPSYAGLHYIMSNKLFTPESISSEEKYDDIDVNLLTNELDINNQILIEKEIEEEEVFLKESDAIINNEN